MDLTNIVSELWSLVVEENPTVLMVTHMVKLHKTTSKCA